MSTPIATASDLATFLGRAVDDPRATQLLAIAQAFCEDVVLPLPASAFGVVLASAARAYANPEQNTGEGISIYSVQRVGSVYLTRAERATLRRGSQTGGAASVSVLSAGANAVQTVTVTATAGTYTLALDGQVTTALAFDATAATVQDAIAALPGVGVGNVVVTGAYVVTFLNARGEQPVSTIVADATGLAGTVAVTVTTVGASAPGSNLPPWEYDYYQGRTGWVQ